MSYNGSGTFLINTAGQPVVSGTVISSTAFNALTADLATGLSTAITKDGQTTVTANIPMGTYKFTGLGAGTAATDSANLSQVQSTVTKLLASVSGADTITAVGSPTLGAYAAGQMFYFIAAGDNTGAVTLNIDSLGAKAVTRDGSVALAAGDIKSGEVVVVVYDGTRFQVVSQINSSGNATFANVSITSALNVGGVATFSAGTAAAPSITTSGDTNNGIFFPATDVTAITTAGSERLRVDASGNMGLGVTPSAWNTYTASQVQQLAVASYTNGDGRITNNAYYNSGWKYIGTNYALAYNLDAGGGAHKWFTAASGSAGGTISFTQAMTLDATGDIFLGANRGIFLSGAGNYDAGVFSSSGALLFQAGIAERARITSGGNFGLGTASPASAGGVALVVYDSSTPRIRLTNSTTGEASTDGAEFNISGSDLIIENRENAPTRFFNNGAERARITSGGILLLGTTSGTAGKLTISDSGNPSEVVYCENTNASFNTRVVSINASRNTTNGTYRFLVCSISNVAAKFEVWDSGNVYNTNGTYGTLSDQRLKQDIVDAPSQWDDIKAIRFRKYRMKNDVEADPNAPSMLGVVAQELEQVCPGLVEEHPDMETVEVTDEEGNVTQTQQPTGTTTKTVKSSILLMKAAVALQEAMARIESLEAKVAALEAK